MKKNELVYAIKADSKEEAERIAHEIFEEQFPDEEFKCLCVNTEQEEKQAIWKRRCATTRH